MVAHLSQAAGVEVDGLGAFAPQGEFVMVALMQNLKTSVVVGVHDVSPDRPFRNRRGQESTDDLRLCRVAASFNKPIKFVPACGLHRTPLTGRRLASLNVQKEIPS